MYSFDLKITRSPLLNDTKNEKKDVRIKVTQRNQTSNFIATCMFHSIGDIYLRSFKIKMFAAFSGRSAQAQRFRLRRGAVAFIEMRCHCELWLNKYITWRTTQRGSHKGCPIYRD